jgi:hypothetical protein
MFSKTLINLIDYAIFPAFLIVTAKILGVVFLSRYFDAQYYVDGVKLVFTNSESFISINSYSSLFMFAAVLGGLIWVVIKAHVFHDTHVTPVLSTHIANLELDELVHSTKTIYSQSFIWLSYAWLTTILFGVQSFFGLSYWWIFFVSFGASIVSTALIVVDIERELKKDQETIKGENFKPESVVTLREVRKEIFG